LDPDEGSCTALHANISKTRSPGAPAACFDSNTIQWIIDRSAVSGDVTIPDIEKAAVRCVVLRITGDLTEAATLLGMARVSLKRWLTRRQ
jgi:hypothetical protein